MDKYNNNDTYYENKSQGFTLPELLRCRPDHRDFSDDRLSLLPTLRPQNTLESVRSELLINAQNLERYYAQHATVKAEAGNPALPPWFKTNISISPSSTSEGPDDNDKKS